MYQRKFQIYQFNPIPYRRGQIWPPHPGNRDAYNNHYIDQSVCELGGPGYGRKMPYTISKIW